MPLLLVVFAILAFFAFAYFRGGEANLRMVSGTEYISGEYGQVIIRLADNSGNPIENANCFATILYPDKSYFLTDYPMQPSSEPGNYYGQFMTPTVNGIYEETITCHFERRGSQQTMKISSSFHVSPALNFIVEMSQLQAQRYQDLVNRINDSRLDIMQEINATFNKSFDELVQNQTALIREDLNQSKNETISRIDDRFEKIYSDMDKLGRSMQEIFGNETG
ncbi:MAG: hypothetical protein JW727_03660 [Candidatus Aenigmarchaeota archaeon]|nr:hypothetical protein [Candidatus Aenigmarchaeota archaeon]